MRTSPIILYMHLLHARKTTAHHQPVLPFQLHMSSPLQIEGTPPQMEYDVVAPQASSTILFDASTTSVEVTDVSDQLTTTEDNFHVDKQSSYIKQFDDDVFWSIFSNAFFLGGGLCYIIASSWDLSLSKTGSDPQYMFLYYSLYVLGPLVYLLNSSIDVIWAVRTEQANKKRRDLEQFFTKAQERAAKFEIEGNTLDVDLPHSPRSSCSSPRKRMSISEEDDDSVSVTSLSGKLGEHKRRMSDAMLKLRRRVGHHFGHRRDISSATTFGAAAIFGTASAIGWASGAMNDNMINRLEMVSIHLYLLSAVFALVGRSKETPVQRTGLMDFFEDAQALENVGDSIFGLASIADVVLADFTFDDNNAWWPLVSAVLWMVDAMLYLRGDFVLLYRHIRMSGYTFQQDETETDVKMMQEIGSPEQLGKIV